MTPAFVAEIDTFGKNAVVCGRSKNVGMPIAMLLHGDGVRPDGEWCVRLSVVW